MCRVANDALNAIEEPVADLLVLNHISEITDENSIEVARQALGISHCGFGTDSRCQFFTIRAYMFLSVHQYE